MFPAVKVSEMIILLSEVCSLDEVIHTFLHAGRPPVRLVRHRQGAPQQDAAACVDPPHRTPLGAWSAASREASSGSHKH